MGDKKHILFICTGNTCRSSMAEALFKDMLQNCGIDNIEVHSAGVAVFFPSGASSNAVEVMKNRNIDLSRHQSRQVTKEMVDTADLVLTMTVSHRERLVHLFPYAADKIFTLKEYVNDADMNRDFDIIDPFGGDLECYDKCADEIYACLQKLLEKLKME